MSHVSRVTWQVHLAERPVFMPNYPGWGFFKFNPWRPKFDQLIRHRAVNEPSRTFVEKAFNKEKDRHCKIRGGSLTALIRQHIEAGLVDEWKWRTWRRMKDSAVKRSIGSTTGFHNHREGPY